MSQIIGKRELVIGIIVAFIGLGFKFNDHLSQFQSRKEWVSYARNIKDKQGTLKKNFSES